MITRGITPGGGLLASFYARDGNGVAALRELTDAVRARVCGRLAHDGVAGEALEDALGDEADHRREGALTAVDNENSVVDSTGRAIEALAVALAALEGADELDLPQLEL